MNKIKYKRKTNPANLSTDSKYNYAFFMTPTSLARQYRFITNSQRAQNLLFDNPLNEIKYNKCVQFETIITTILSNLEIRTRSTAWIWNRFYNRDKNELRGDWEILLNKADARNQFYYEYNTTHHNNRCLEFSDENSGKLYHVRLPTIVEMSMSFVDNMNGIFKSDVVNPPTMVMNDIEKYSNETFNDITKYLFNGLRVLLNGKRFNLVMRFLDMFESFLDFNKGIYEAAIVSINDNDYDRFSHNFGLLVNNDVVTKFSDLNDNITVKLPSDGEVTNTHCIYKFFEALNATKNSVLLIPNKKHYHKVTLPTVGNRPIIDTFNVYFETKDDVERFSQIYKHYNSYSEIVLCQTTIDDHQTNGDFLNIHEYDYQHTQIFKDKLSKSSIPVHISTRTTPYKGDDIHGYIHLGTIITDIGKGVFYDVTLLEYLEGIEKRLRKLGISEELVYSRNTYYTFSSQPFGGAGISGKQLSPTIMVVNEKHGKSGIRYGSYDEMRKRYYTWHNSSKFGNSLLSDPVNKVHVAIPIRCVGDRMDGVLALIRRQKLVNDLGGFKIQTITIAPYAPYDSEATEAIVDAISEL